MSNYNKPWCSFEEQLALIKSRGLEVTDDSAALSYLQRIGYYRLSAYWYPFRQRFPSKNKDEFIAGAKFQHAVQLYVYDKELCLLLLDAIERIEIAIRVDLAYTLGLKDPFAHRKPELLHGHFTKKVNAYSGLTKHQEWLEKLDRIIKRSKEDFIRHYKQKYGLPFPIWVSVELWDFGLLSNFYKGLSVFDKSSIAKKYQLPEGKVVKNWQIMESWLRSINYVRNVAAHHSRLWNRNIIDQPKLPERGKMPAFEHAIGESATTSRVYIIFCILLHFMQQIYPNSSSPARLKEFILAFPVVPRLSIADMGFPDNWQQEAIWQIDNSTAKRSSVETQIK